MKFVYKPGPTFNPAPFTKVVAAAPDRIRNVQIGGKWYTRFECRPDDKPDGCRAELIASQRIGPVETWCMAWSYLTGDGTTGDRFVAADRWTTLGQIHFDEVPPHRVGSPFTQLLAKPGAGGDDLLWSVRADPAASSGGPEIRIDKVPLGRESFFLASVSYSHVDFWRGVGAPPDLSVAPISTPCTVPQSPLPAWYAYGPQAGVYRNPGGNPATIAYLGGLAVGATLAEAVSLAGWDVAAPAPTNRDLADKAAAAFKRANVLYPTYARNLAAGKYPDPLKTAWGEGLDALGRIK